MDNRFFGSLEALDNQVQAGEIAGYTAWPTEGVCEVLEVTAEHKNGKPYFGFKLRHPVKGVREFLVRVPQATDKDAAKFMGMQRIYATLYPISGSTPGKVTVQTAFESASKVQATMEFRLEEYESFSEKTGKSYTNQNLESLTLVSNGGGFA